jgi:unsaturated chondroitin disaccharide hydrolase
MSASGRARACRSRRGCWVAALALTVLVACSDRAPVSEEPFDDLVRSDLRFARQQLRSTAAFVQTGSYPFLTRSSGDWSGKGPSWWTSGFYPGSLWLVYGHTRNPYWRAEAQRLQAGLESQKNNDSTHDVGFIVFNSFGNGYKATGDASYRKVVLRAAASLASRYSPKVGAIRSWGDSSSHNFTVIIDNMMNLELLFWASRHGGKRAWYRLAVKHAERTMRDHVRPDGSTYHVVDYNPDTGAVRRKRTAQGYRAGSTWSRGQAWALYGFAMTYRETGDARFLQTARKAADWFLDHLPPDKIPLWDFSAQGSQPRDSSAAAIAASGLLELSTREPQRGRGRRYRSAARSIIRSLSSRAYLARGTPSQSILLHGTANKPSGESNSGLIFGDYYFVEALLRSQGEALGVATRRGAS